MGALVQIIVILLFYTVLLYTRKPPPERAPPKSPLQTTPKPQTYIERVFSKDNLAGSVYRDDFVYATPWIGNFDLQNGIV